MLDDPKPVTSEVLVSNLGTKLDSETLRRLIEEVRTASMGPTAYNRMHNRHNRT